MFLTVARHKGDISAEPGLWKLSLRAKLTLSKRRKASPSSRNCPSLLWVLLFQQHWNLRQEMDKSTALLSPDYNNPSDKGCKHLKLCYKETFQPIRDYSAFSPPPQVEDLKLSISVFFISGLRVSEQEPSFMEKQVMVIICNIFFLIKKPCFLLSSEWAQGTFVINFRLL